MSRQPRNKPQRSQIRNSSLRSVSASASGDNRKRTIAISLMALGAGAVTYGMVNGSGQSGGPKMFRDVRACEQDPQMVSSQCSTFFSQANAAHERSAPGFVSREQCEKEYGAGQCVNPSATSGRSTSYIPLMTGYLVGSRAAGGYQAAPLYRRPGDPEGEFRQSAAFPASTGGSSSSSSSSRSSSRWSSWSSSSSRSSTSRPTSSSRSYSTSRGGFGSSGRSSFGS